MMITITTLWDYVTLGAPRWTTAHDAEALPAPDKFLAHPARD